MVEVYSWGTPDGHEVHLMLEPCGVQDRAHPIDIGSGDPFPPGFLKISPNDKIPGNRRS